jgi:hypothetical protein
VTLYRSSLAANLGAAFSVIADERKKLSPCDHKHAQAKTISSLHDSEIAACVASPAKISLQFGKRDE